MTGRGCTLRDVSLLGRTSQTGCCPLFAFTSGHRSQLTWLVLSDQLQGISGRPLRRDVALPEALHFGRHLQEVAQCAFGFDPAVLEEMMWLARRSATRRCETTRQVTSRSANRRSHSVRSVSRVLDRSSMTRRSGCRTNIRAAAVRWICPPESFTPRGPTIVSRPCSSVSPSRSSTAGPRHRRGSRIGHCP